MVAITCEVKIAVEMPFLKLRDAVLKMPRSHGDPQSEVFAAVFNATVVPSVPSFLPAACSILLSPLLLQCIVAMT